MGIHFPDLNHIAHDAVDHVIRPAIDGGRHLLDDVVHQAESKLTNLAHDAEGKIKQTAHDAEGKISGMAHSVEGEIKQIAVKAEGRVKSAASDAAHGLQNAAEKAVDEAIKVLASKALKKLLAVMEVAVPDSFELQVGFVGFSVEDLDDRLDTIKKWLNNPPGKSQIKEMILEFAPTHVWLDGTVACPIAESIQLSGKITFNVEKSFEKVEKALEKI